MFHPYCGRGTYCLPAVNNCRLKLMLANTDSGNVCCGVHCYCVLWGALLLCVVGCIVIVCCGVHCYCLAAALTGSDVTNSVMTA